MVYNRKYNRLINKSIKLLIYLGGTALMEEKMQRCIYGDSMDLTVSDIIPYALTGAKITRRFVCRKHNKETNEKFESNVIERFAVFRNYLGLKTREGNTYRKNRTRFMYV